MESMDPIFHWQMIEFSEKQNGVWPNMKKVDHCVKKAKRNNKFCNRKFVWQQMISQKTEIKANVPKAGATMAANCEVRK